MTRLLCTLIALGSTAASATGFTFRNGDRDDDDAWVVVQDAHSVTMSGSMLDLRRAKKHLKNAQGEFLWFRRGGKQYLVEDRGLVERIVQATRPQQELGQRQSRLGQQQSELGRRQAELGREQAAIAARQAKAALKAAKREMARALSEEDEDEDREDHETRRRAERERERELESEQRELQQEQEELGREQEALGRQQEQLGREQERLSKTVERAVADAIDGALRAGLARETD